MIVSVNKELEMLFSFYALQCKSASTIKKLVELQKILPVWNKKLSFFTKEITLILIILALMSSKTG